MGVLDRVFTWLRSLGFGDQRSIQSLDGLRAVAVAFVLLAHLAGTRRNPFFIMGEFGVRIFFVISGYLITSILLKELRKTGDISLSRFYFRRMLRLFPASYFLIAVVAVLATKHLVSLAHSDLVFAISYTMNYHEMRGWTLGHLWSLAIEEQFYFLWPILLLLLTPKRATKLLIAVMVLAPLCRFLSPYVGPTFDFLIWSDALATGCLLALTRDLLFASGPYARILSSPLFVIIPIVTIALNYVPSTKIQWLVCGTAMNVGVAITIDWALRNVGGFVGRVLNCPSVVFVGVLSYSLYLWQQLFLNRMSSSPLCAFPLNIILSFAAALGSYLLVEVPSLRLRAMTQKGSITPANLAVEGTLLRID